MSDELKPCGSCGSVEAEIGIIGGVTFWVECSACGACSSSHDDEYDAIAAWNHRPIEDALQARIDALEWLREVEAYDPHAEHPLCTAAGNSSERGKMFARAEAEHEAILAAARETVES